MPTITHPSRRIALALLIALSAFATARAWDYGQAVGGLDHYQFWVVGEAVDHDKVSNPYADAERARMGALYLDRATHGGGSERQIALATNRAVLETYSTPFLYTAMHWLAGGDYERDLARWRNRTNLGKDEKEELAHFRDRQLERAIDSMKGALVYQQRSDEKKPAEPAPKSKVRQLPGN